MKYSFALSNKSVSIYDHEIQLTYNVKLSVFKEHPFMFAMYQDEGENITLYIEKKTGIATFSYSFTQGNISGQYSLGNCTLQN